MQKKEDSESFRLDYIDNIRWMMIILVVIMHLKVTYSSMGLWYYNEPVQLDKFSYVIFGIYGSFIQAFFMGILFFIAGYFSPKSLDKKGRKKFILDRLMRLGLPSLIFMLILNPATSLIASFSNYKISENIFQSYVNYILSFDFLSGSGPLWFCVALLFFSVIYVLFGLFLKKSKNIEKPYNLSNYHMILTMIIMSIITFLARIYFPSGSDAYTFLNMQLGNFAQYIIMYILGVYAYRKNILNNLTYNFGKKWLIATIVIGAISWCTMLILGGGISNPEPFFKGLTWQSFAYSAWESFFCIGTSIGLLALFKKYFNFKGDLSAYLSENAFAVYVFHPVIIVLMAELLSGFAIYPLIKMIIVAFVSLPVCFALASYLRKIKIMKRIFS